jgi:UDP-N-acetyl-D-mannosaminuronic acid transferase (WecB/TagA/CpsF family)
VWTSLRAPKQDFLAALLVPYLRDGIVMVGVGAAFRIESGEYKQPEGTLQKMGLAGLLINRKDSSFWTEFRWYSKHTRYLIQYIVVIWYWRLTGKKYYE